MSYGSRVLRQGFVDAVGVVGSRLLSFKSSKGRRGYKVQISFAIPSPNTVLLGISLRGLLLRTPVLHQALPVWSGTEKPGLPPASKHEDNADEEDDGEDDDEDADADGYDDHRQWHPHHNHGRVCVSGDAGSAAAADDDVVLPASSSSYYG